MDVDRGARKEVDLQTVVFVVVFVVVVVVVVYVGRRGEKKQGDGWCKFAARCSSAHPRGVVVALGKRPEPYSS